MQSTNKRIIRLPEVIHRTGLSRSTIYKLISTGNFPKQIKLSARSMGFLEHDVEDWVSTKLTNQ
jgi:prophage regulatory protein